MVIADGDKIIPPETCCVFCFCWCENRSYIISQIRLNTYKWMCCWNQFKRGNCLIKQNFMFAFSSNYFFHLYNNLIIFNTLIEISRGWKMTFIFIGFCQSYMFFKNEWNNRLLPAKLIFLHRLSCVFPTITGRNKCK